MVFITSTKGTAGEQTVRALVATAPIEQAAGAAALDEELVRRGMARLHQRLGAVDEVAEGVLLHEHAVVVPGLARLVAAADVGDGVGRAQVEQADALAGEGGHLAQAMSAVAHEPERDEPEPSRGSPFLETRLTRGP